jgi:hypothetical protein
MNKRAHLRTPTELLRSQVLWRLGSSQRDRPTQGYFLDGSSASPKRTLESAVNLR